MVFFWIRESLSSAVHVDAYVGSLCSSSELDGEERGGDTELYGSLCPKTCGGYALVVHVILRPV